MVPGRWKCVGIVTPCQRINHLSKILAATFLGIGFCSAVPQNVRGADNWITLQIPGSATTNLAGGSIQQDALKDSQWSADGGIVFGDWFDSDKARYSIPMPPAVWARNLGVYIGKVAMTGFCIRRIF